MASQGVSTFTYKNLFTQSATRCFPVQCRTKRVQLCHRWHSAVPQRLSALAALAASWRVLRFLFQNIHWTNLTHKIHQNTIYSLILFVWLKGHFEIIRYTSIQFSHVCFPENDQIKTLHITYITIPKILDVGFLNRGWFRSSFCEPILCGFVRFKLQDTQIWMWNIWCAILVYIGLCWISILFKLPIQDWGRCAYLHCRWLNVHLKGLVWGSWGNGAGFPVAARWKRQIINRMEQINQNICKCLLQTMLAQSSSPKMKEPEVTIEILL